MTNFTNITSSFDPADNGFVALSATLIFGMTPGVGIFYAGFFKDIHVIHELSLNFVCLPLVIVQFVTIGYSLIFSNGSTVLGGKQWMMLLNLGTDTNIYAISISPLTHCAFEMMFAIVSSAIIVGAIGNRLKFFHWCFFVIFWQTFSYDIIARALWAKTPKGFLAQFGALDFAGGLVVHVNAGVSALVASWFLSPSIRRNQTDSDEESRPHSYPLFFVGFAMLWIGWTMFNAGSALAANNIASQAFLNTNIAAAAGSMIVFIDMIKSEGNPASFVMGITGAVIGLVAITPAAGFVDSWAALVIGFSSSLIVYILSNFKYKLQKTKYNSLLGNDISDVFLSHGVGGALGAILTGVFASAKINPNGVDGLIYSKNFHLLKAQLLALLIATIISGAVTAAFFLLWKLAGKINNRLSAADYGIKDAPYHFERKSGESVGLMN